MDRSLEAIAGPPVAQTTGPQVPAPIPAMSDRTLMCVIPDASMLGNYISLTRSPDKNTSGLVEIVTKTKSFVGARIDTAGGTTNGSIVCTSDRINHVLVLRTNGGLTSADFAQDAQWTNPVPVIPGDGITPGKLLIGNPACVWAGIYDRTLTNGEITQLTSWLTARYLT